MIDVHCLIHKYSPFFHKIHTQMSNEDNVNFHIINNTNLIGNGMCLGFSLGNSDYVSYVDYDDLIEPGIFKEIEDVMDQGYDWCYTDQKLIDENDNILQEGWSSCPELYNESILQFTRYNNIDCFHHILTFKRKLITLDIACMLKEMHELPETYLARELYRKSKNYKHINKIGYYWRQHQDNWYKKTSYYNYLINGGKNND
jgi:hypothetical protein